MRLSKGSHCWIPLQVLCSAILLVTAEGCSHHSRNASLPNSTAPSIPRASHARLDAVCPDDIDVSAHAAFRAVQSPAEGACKAGIVNGYPAPDPACTPGAINPTVTFETLTALGFKTSCLRNQATSQKEKNETYAWYGI